MINPEVLLSDLKKLLGQLEGDLRERADEVPSLGESLRSAYQHAKQAERTAQPFETWREDYLTQAAVAWILACVFVRFIEDNGMIDTPFLAGSGARLDQAKDQRTLYFQQHPTDSDREYLHYVFQKVEVLPAAAPLFAERHNPLWAFGVSGDGATLLIEFWQRIDPGTGALAHDFTDPALNTRFLGDVYQDLSEAARKKYALLQTPEFVEEFILDRTLTPAIAEFGLGEVRLIDPACGSGHFLLGAFHRLLHEWQKQEPAVNVRELAQRAFGAVYGVDLNPYAVAIARFRLLIAALRASDVHRLVDAPAFRMNLATGDSLLHGPRPGGERQLYLQAEADPLRHVYDTEDAEELRRILGGRYHVVVGNPPYITVKDRALNDAYRRRFGSCHMKYSLAVPFMERFFDLAISPSDVALEPAGYIGMITANSFMKREFGRKLIEEYLPRWDLTHVIDTSGAHIPGHGTPTVILLGRHRKPLEETLRAVLGIRGEPQTPEDPSRGLVWSAIVRQVDRPGSSSEFVSVADMPRVSFHHHPWSIGGGGAAELKDVLEDNAAIRLGDLAESIGFASFTGADEVFTAPAAVFRRKRVPPGLIREFVYGEAVRDWVVRSDFSALTPYRGDFTPEPFSAGSAWGRLLWPFQTTLAGIVSFGGKTRAECGDDWWTWYRWVAEKYRIPLSISFAAIATHNHFVFDDGRRVFKQSSPVIKLPIKASEEDHLALLGLLNSSLACFWMKQVFHCKGAQGINEGGKSEKWEQFFDFDGTKIRSFPIPSTRPIQLTRAILDVARMAQSIRPSTLVDQVPFDRDAFTRTQHKSDLLFRELVSWQEELDWHCYYLYGLTNESLSGGGCTVQPIRLGERAFEIAMARRMSVGQLDTAWFERHQSTPITEVPTEWPADYSELVRRRIAMIEANPDIALIEQPEYKRRWNVEPWAQQQQRALHEWLLTRLEASALWSGGDLTSVNKLADHVRRDTEFMQVAEVYRGRADFDVTALVAELVESDAVPCLPVLRYRPTGLRVRLFSSRWESQS